MLVVYIYIYIERERERDVCLFAELLELVRGLREEGLEARGGAQHGVGLGTGTYYAAICFDTTINMHNVFIITPTYHYYYYYW